MLQKLRSKSAGIVAKSLMVLLIIAFGTWGVQGYLSQTQLGDTVATVGSESIGSRELALAFGRDIRRFKAQGADITAEQARNMGLMDMSLERLIEGRAYDEAARWLGMGISKERIAQAIREEELFRDDSGNFSRSRFEFLLRNSGTSENEYVADLRRDMLRREIINSMAFTAGAPDVLEKKLHLYRNEQRVARLILVPQNDKLNVGTPDDATVAQIHQEQAERFTAPERRSATYLLLTSARAMKDVTVSEDEARQRYDDNIAAYTAPETRSVQQMRFADEETARKAAALLGEGRSFAAVAKEVAGIEGDALKYGDFETGKFPIAELAGVIDGLAEGSVSEPLKTDFGWHIFHLASIRPEAVKPFEEVRGEVEESLKIEAAGERLIALSNDLEDALAAGNKLEDAAAKLGLETANTGLTDIAGAGVDGTPVKTVPGPELLSSMFVTAAGEQSALGQLADGSYFVLRVDEVVPSALRPVAEVRDLIVADWQAGKRREAVQERALALVGRIEGGEDIAAVAAAEGLALSESKPFNRGGEGGDSKLLTPVLVSDLFRVQPGQAAMSETAEGFVVASLKSIQAAGPSDTAELGVLIGNQMMSDVLRQFSAALRTEFGVEVDQAAKARTPLPQ